MILEPRVGPYMGIVADATKTIRVAGAPRKFRVLAYTAYNAMGLIGTECHGLVVLDEDRKQVVADEMGVGVVGYPACDPAPLKLFHARVMALSGKEFRAAVNRARHLRYSI